MGPGRAHGHPAGLAASCRSQNHHFFNLFFLISCLFNLLCCRLQRSAHVKLMQLCTASPAGGRKRSRAWPGAPSPRVLSPPGHTEGGELRVLGRATGTCSTQGCSETPAGRLGDAPCQRAVAGVTAQSLGSDFQLFPWKALGLGLSLGLFSLRLARLWAQFWGFPWGVKARAGAASAGSQPQPLTSVPKARPL